MNQQFKPAKGFAERTIEAIIALVLLRFVVQVALAVIAPYIPYALGGLLVFGVCYVIYRRRSNW